MGVVVAGGFAVVVGLAVLLVVSPASFVSLAPDWLTPDGTGRTAAWAAAGFSAAVAGLLGFLRGRGRWLRAAVVSVLLLFAAAFGAYAMSLGDTDPDKPKEPENTCVAYSGGRHTCPGG